jgi:hypothetical protein
MIIIQSIVIDLVTRVILVILGIGVSIVGFFSPSICIQALAKITITARERK